jgi:hypothetical protein
LIIKAIREELAKQSNERRAKSEKSFVDTLLWMYRDHDFRLIAGLKKYFNQQREQAIEIVNKYTGDFFLKQKPMF